MLAPMKFISSVSLQRGIEPRLTSGFGTPLVDAKMCKHENQRIGESAFFLHFCLWVSCSEYPVSRLQTLFSDVVNQIALVVLEVKHLVTVGVPHGLSFQVIVVFDPHLGDAAF